MSHTFFFTITNPSLFLEHVRSMRFTRSLCVSVDQCGIYACILTRLLITGRHSGGISERHFWKCWFWKKKQQPEKGMQHYPACKESNALTLPTPELRLYILSSLTRKVNCPSKSDLRPWMMSHSLIILGISLFNLLTEQSDTIITFSA